MSSLLDALLLDAHRDPHEVWIAVRADGQKGSGTQADPWNASVIPYPTVSITSLTKAGSVATAATTPAHGFATGDMVTISGVTRVNSLDVYYVGTFPVTVLNADSFKYSMLGEPPASSAQGTITCWREREQFDAIMRMIPANTRIHLGPGVFETKGVCSNIAGGIIGKGGSWHIQAGQHIIGAGISLTTLKLVNASFPENQWFTISHITPYGSPIPHHCEVADLTVDCNIAGQPNQQVACAAINIAASHVRIRRVRVINFGSQTAAYVENFVITLGAINSDLGVSEAHDSVMEDCIAERTCANAISNSTIFHLGAGESASGIHGYHRDFAIRNCYADGRIVYGSQVPVPVNTINYSGGVVTITTKAPHLLSHPGNAIVSGVTVSGNPANLFNGVFAVDQIVSATEFKYNLNTTDTPDAATGAVGGGVSSHRTNIEKIEKIDPDPADRRFRITTREPHFRTTNNNAQVYGVLKPEPGAADLYSIAFNGSFAVIHFDPSKPKELEYTLLQAPDADVAQLKYYAAFVNIGHQGLSAGGGFGTVVEGNRIYHCSVGGPYHDTFSTGDVIARNNYYHDVLSGPTEALGGGISSNSRPILLASLTHQGNTAIASTFTSGPHGFRANDRVIISNVTGNNATRYNGNVVITNIPSATEFQYQMSDTPNENAPPGAGYGTYEEFATAFGRVMVQYQTRLESFTRVERDARFFGEGVTVLTKHGLIVGDAIRITKAGAFQNGEFPPFGSYHGYTGVFRVTHIVDPQTFEYEFLDANGNPYDPGVPGSNFSPGYFGRLWQVKRLVIENNVIELAIRALSGYGEQSGIPLYGTRPFPPEYTVREAILRNNVIRNANDAFSTDNRGIELYGCEQCLLENNILNLDEPTPIRHNVVGTVNTFNNLSPDGKLIRSINLNSPYDTAHEVVVKVQSDLEDAIVASLLDI